MLATLFKCKFCNKMCFFFFLAYIFK